MKSDYAKYAKELLQSLRLGGYRRKETVALAMVCVSIFAGVVILVRLGGLVVTTAGAKALVKHIAAEGKPDANDVENNFNKRKEIADELKKKNAFAPPPPKKHPVEQVAGILGSEALINGKWYKAGDSVEDAKIVAIEPTQVKIEWQGDEKTFAPIASSGSSGKQHGPPGKDKAKDRDKDKDKDSAKPSEARERRREGRAGRNRERPPMPPNMSPEEREKFMAEMRERRRARRRNRD